MPRGYGGTDSRREQHRRVGRLPCIRGRYQVLSIGQDLRSERPALLGLLCCLGRTLAFHPGGLGSVVPHRSYSLPYAYGFDSPARSSYLGVMILLREKCYAPRHRRDRTLSAFARQAPAFWSWRTARDQAAIPPRLRSLVRPRRTSREGARG